MDEAERLCNRLALIDSGRVAAIDSPAGLVARADGQQRVRFRPSVPIDERLLRAIPEVAEVRHHGDQVIVTGTRNLLQAVASTLAKNQVIAEDLRVDQASLDDAFVALTGRQIEE
jgi:ABC-2 type transport system ATP-binding protein